MNTKSTKPAKSSIYTKLVNFFVDPLKLFFFFSVIYIAISFIPKSVGMTDTIGDEPHYIMMTHALVKDGNLNNLAQYYKDEKLYHQWYKSPLIPHLIVLNNKPYAYHQIGLSFVLIPGYFLAGLRGIWITTSLLTALGMVFLYKTLLYYMDKKFSLLTTVVSGLSLPIGIFSNQIYPETLLLCLVTGIVAFILKPDFKLTIRSGIILGLALAFIPTLHIKFIVITGIIGLYLVINQFKKIPLKGIIAFVLFTGTLIGLYLIWLNSYYDNRFMEASKVIAANTTLSIVEIPTGLLGILVDRENGILIFSPFYIYMFYGAVLIFRKAKTLKIQKAITYLFPFILTILFSLFFTMFPYVMGGMNPPGRYNLPIMAGVGIALGLAFKNAYENKTGRILLFGLICYSLIVFVILCFNPMLALPFGIETPLFSFLFKENAHVLINAYLPNLSKYFRVIPVVDLLKGIGVFIFLLTISSFHHFYSFKFKGKIPEFLYKPRSIFVLFFIVYGFLCFAPRTGGGMSLTSGDEPHYLIATYSMLYDGDIEIMNNYKNYSYHTWYPVPYLYDHTIPLNGKHYPLHQLGLSVYILPAFAIGQRLGVTLFLAFLTSLSVMNIYVLLQYFVSKKTALFTTIITGLSVPVFVYSILIYPEVVLLFLITWVFRIILNPQFKLGFKNGLLLILLTGFMPPLHFKFIIIIGIILLYIDVLQFKKIKLHNLVIFNILVMAASSLYLVWMYNLFEGHIFEAMYYMSAKNKFLLQYIPGGFIGSLVDRENGIFIFAPIFIYIFIGFGYFMDKFKSMDFHTKMTRIFIVTLVLVQTIFITMYPHLLGGQNPSGRYYLAIFPALLIPFALAMEIVLKYRIHRIIITILLIHTFIITVILAFNPILSLPFSTESNLVTFILRGNAPIVHAILPNFSRYSRTIQTDDYIKGTLLFIALLVLSYSHIFLKEKPVTVKKITIKKKKKKTSRS